MATMLITSFSIWWKKIQIVTLYAIKDIGIAFVFDQMDIFDDGQEFQFSYFKHNF